MIRLGRISYANMAPVFYRLDADVEEITGVPTDLNARLLAGEVDVAPISSIEYARNADLARKEPRVEIGRDAGDLLHVGVEAIKNRRHVRVRDAAELDHSHRLSSL